ncbi:MAG: ribulose-phosphate 3-epimerase [Candidatus Bipolaricaulota bacterium]
MKLVPSLLAADLARLAQQARLVEDVADMLHFDVMDGHFVPNLTFGPPVCNALRRHTKLPLEIHLMIDRPATYIPRFEVGPEDCITVHVESVDLPEESLAAIRALGCLAGITVRPNTPLEAVLPYLAQVERVLVMSVDPGFGGQAFNQGSLERIRKLREAIGDREVTIAVDGGIGKDNIAQVVSAGGDIIVAGSSVFGTPDPRAAAWELREAAG